MTVEEKQAKINKWISHKHYQWALFFICIIEGLFPLPGDIVLLALIQKYKSTWKKFITIAYLGHITGSLILYGVGYYGMDLIGHSLLESYGWVEKYQEIHHKISNQSAALVLFTFAFLPLPFKLASLAAGTLNISLSIFIATSLLGRIPRYLLQCYIVLKYGDNVLSIIFKKPILAVAIGLFFGIGGLLILTII